MLPLANSSALSYSAYTWLITCVTYMSGHTIDALRDLPVVTEEQFDGIMFLSGNWRTAVLLHATLQLP